MNHFHHFRCTLQRLLPDDGQDLVEYALVAALIALACTASMRTLSSALNTAFSTIGSKVTSGI